ncbi:TetR family transcriptional regulator [Nakamurella sp. YIM 132087]|uniref:TetR family transcriptional regulator n=1 Tax=Nakamurella alba TaxID=2665158 RepID=A0A7K1FNE1_9ACTN|nr:TetR family transcriptional regulator C-terminal domain-containing protein [Nakamurella alba]MTD15682.1 TetR family transcriptional regulator [Nakamurella alba]
MAGGPRRLPPEVRRRMLLEAARSVIAERGLHATTVRDVAAAGEVAVGTVTYHFAGIEEVLAGVLELETESFSDPVYQRAEQAATGREGVAELIDGLLGSDAASRAHWQLWLDFWAMAAHRPTYSAWQSQIYRDLHALAGRLLARADADGSLRVADPQSAAVEFIALMDGLVVQAYLPDAALSPSRARRILHGYVDSALTG